MDSIIDICAVLSDLYEKRYEYGYENIVNYLTINDLLYNDLIIYFNSISNEILRIEELENEIQYTNQIQTTFKIVPKKIEIVIHDDFLTNIENLSHEYISNNPSFIKEKLYELGITGYKYELKYLIISLDSILKDGNVWENLELY